MNSSYQTPVQSSKSYPWCNYYNYNSSGSSYYSTSDSFSSNDSTRASPSQYNSTNEATSTPYSSYYNYSNYTSPTYYSQYYSPNYTPYNQSYNYQYEALNTLDKIPYNQDLSFDSPPKSVEEEVISVPKKTAHQDFDEKVLPLLESKNLKKRMRHDFSPEQKDYLLSIFKQTTYPSKDILEQTASRMGTTTLVIQTWFKNTRSKQKKLANIPEAENLDA